MVRRRFRARATKQSAGLSLGLQIRGVLPPAIAAMHVTEYRFHPVRLWRFDHAFPPLRVALEIEGGLFKGHRSKQALVQMAHLGQRMTPADVALVQAVAGGRHSQAATMELDIIKYAEASAAGWLVIRVTPEMVEDGRAITWLERTIQSRSERI
jgi:hypothetical protein